MRETLAGEPTLAAAIIDTPAAPLLAPLVADRLTPRQATGLDLILEGFLLHYGTPRQLAPADRPTAVLAGDYCYAQGLVRVASANNLFHIRALADLIALGANLIAANERALAALLWRATIAAIAVGSAAAAIGLTDGCRLIRAGDLPAGRDALDALTVGFPPIPELLEALT